MAIATFFPRYLLTSPLRTWLPAGLGLLLLCQTGCGIHDFAGTVARGQAGTHRGSQSSPKTNPAPDPLPMLREFVSPGTHVVAFTQRLRPTTADLQTLFSPSLAAALEKAYAPLWDSGQPLIAPHPGQTQVRLRASATTDEIITWSGAAHQLPAGYQQLGQHLKPGFTIHCFEFFTPGSESGMAFNGLVFVNDHWVLCPTPWNALPAATTAGYSQPTNPPPGNPQQATLAPSSAPPAMVRPAPYYPPSPYTAAPAADEHFRQSMQEHQWRMEESRRRSEAMQRAHEQQMRAIQQRYRP